MDSFIKLLKKHSAMLTRQQVRTLRGQAIAGDVIGAEKGLRKLLRRKGETEWNT